MARGVNFAVEQLAFSARLILTFSFILFAITRLRGSSHHKSVVDGKGRENNIVALAILVRKGGTDLQPKRILILASIFNRIHIELWGLTLGHNPTPSISCMKLQVNEHLVELCMSGARITLDRQLALFCNHLYLIAYFACLYPVSFLSIPSQHLLIFRSFAWRP